jgi:hypothetical protein
LIQAAVRSRLNQAAACLASAFVVVAFVGTLNGWRRYVVDERLDGDDRYQLSYRQRVNAVRAILADSPDARIEPAGPFTGQQPAYLLAFVQEIEKSLQRNKPLDRSRVYWMDELHGDDITAKGLADLEKVWPFLRDVRVEKFWRVGPTRIFKLVGTPTADHRP